MYWGGEEKPNKQKKIGEPNTHGSEFKDQKGKVKEEEVENKMWTPGGDYSWEKCRRIFSTRDP